MNGSLHGMRVLVPPSRIALNPLQTMLRRTGAEVVSFPALAEVRPSADALDRALARVNGFHWLVFAGAASVEHFFERLDARGTSRSALGGHCAAIGHGALKALRAQGVEVAYRPKEHFGEGVAAGMLPVAGQSILLVRAVHASDALPQRLRAAGADVTAVAGHEMRVVTSPAEARAAWASPLDLVAFANPATVRIFAKAMQELGLDPVRCLAGVVIAAVGPATAQAAESHALPADHIAGGRLKKLLDSLIHLAKGAPQPSAER